MELFDISSNLLLLLSLGLLQCARKQHILEVLAHMEGTSMP